MPRISAEQLLNLRMGIPIAAMAASSVAAQVVEKQVEPQVEKNQKVEKQTLNYRGDESDEKTFVAEAKLFQSLQFDKTEKEIYIGEDLGERQSIKSFDEVPADKLIKEKRDSLQMGYKNFDANKAIEIDDSQVKDHEILKGPSMGRFDAPSKKIKLRVMTYDDEFVNKFVQNRVMGNPSLAQNIAQQMNIEDPKFEDFKGFIVSYLETYTNKERLEHTARHESKHLDNDRKGINLPGISPQQNMMAEQTNEISANISELLYQRELYLETGNIDKISDDFGFYKEAIINKEIVPGSRVKQMENQELGLIMNGTQNMWKEEFQEYYLQKQIVPNAQDYIDKYKNNIRVLEPNSKELEKRERQALTFKINDREVDLYERRHEPLAIPMKHQEKLNDYQQKATNGLNAKQLDRIEKIKDPQQLDKLKLEKCSEYDKQERKNKALKILEKQGRIAAPIDRSKTPVVGNAKLLPKQKSGAEI